MKTNNFIKLSFEILEDKYETHLTHFDQLLDILVLMYFDKIDNNNTIYSDERLYYIDLITQKFMTHGFSLKKLINGISIDSVSRGVNIKIFDPFSIHSLVRIVIENYLVQNYLSNTLYPQDILECRFEIWMRYGLLQRKINPENEEEKRVTELDEKSIDEFEKLIKTKDCFQRLSENKKLSFLRTINKEWKIAFNDDKFYPLSWKELIKEAGVIDGVSDNMYNFLSWHAHSQSISILQFKDTWKNDSDKNSIKMSIKKLNMYISFMISDIIKCGGFEKSYKTLNSNYKDLINFYNISYRGENFMVEPLND